MHYIGWLFLMRGSSGSPLPHCPWAPKLGGPRPFLARTALATRLLSCLAGSPRQTPEGARVGRGSRQGIAHCGDRAGGARVEP